MEKNQRSIESVYKDQTLVDAMWLSDKRLGNEISYGESEDRYADNKVIVDNFLENHRWRDINLGSIINASNKVEDMSEDERTNFAYALKEIERVPSAGQEGGADLTDAIIDYAGATIADPTNLASIIAGGFSFGTAGVATFAAKEAAKQAAKAGIKAKLKAMVGKAGVASMVVDGSIAGAGGGYHSIAKQEMEKDLDLRKDVSYLEAALQGAVEGVASPLIGFTGALGAQALGKGISNIAPEPVKEAVSQGKDFMARYLMPTAGLNETQRRLIERPTGEMILLKEDTDILYNKLNKAIQDNPDLNTDINKQVLNKALEGDKQSLIDLQVIDQSVSDLIGQSRLKIKEAQDFAAESGLSKDIKGLFEGEKDYVRDIYEVYTTKKRAVPFEKFIKENPEVLDQLKASIRKKPTATRWEHIARDYIDLDTKKIISGQEGIEDATVKKIAAELYKPTTKLRRETAPLLKKKLKMLDDDKIPPIVQKIMGRNNDPALRVLESVNGLIESSARTNAIRNIAYDSVRNNYGYISKARNIDAARAEAIEKLGTKDVMRLVGVPDGGGPKKVSKKQETVTSLEDDVIDEGLKFTFVTKKEGEKLKMLLDEQDKYRGDGILASTGRAISGLQGFLKSGKTLYNPIGTGRNLLGALGYTFAGGNTRGILDAAGLVLDKATKQERSLLEEEFITSGLKGSNIDLNQAMKRLGDVSSKENNQSFWKDGEWSDVSGKVSNLARSGGLSILPGGAKLAKGMRTVYAAGDDIFKYGTFVNEKRKASSVFDGYTKAQQDGLLTKFKDDFFIDPKNAKGEEARELLKNAYLKEEAARVTANITPVYDRIPKLLEMMRGVPIVGSFTAYPAERMRNRYNIMKYASEEVTRGAAEGNKALLSQGVARLSSFGTMVAGLHTGAHLLNEYNNFSEEEAILRTNGAKYDKNGALLITGKDKDGKITYHNLNYLHPDSDMLNAVTPIILKSFRGEDVSKDLDEALMESAYGLVQPYVSPSLAVDFAKDMLGYAQTGEDYYIKNAYKIIEPGYASIIRDFAHQTGNLNTSIDEVLYPDRFGVPVEKAKGAADLINKTTGGIPGITGGVPFVKQKTFDPKLGLAFALKEISSNVSKEDRDFTSDLKSTILNENRSSPDNVLDSELSILEKYSELLQVKHEEQRALYKVVNNLKGVMNDHQIRRFLKTQGKAAKSGLSNKVISSAMNGRSYSKGKGTSNAFWKDISETLYERKGSRDSTRLNNLRNLMRQMEGMYDNINLLDDAPEVSLSVGK